jgi:transposase
MASAEQPWTDHEIARMHPWWTQDGCSISEIARRLDRSKNMVNAKISRLRIAEGNERWPERGSPIKAKTTRVKRAVRAGQTTLPPLASLT